jgi:prepilin-type N-terminal cleavage/methylation domain-containing protein
MNPPKFRRRAFTLIELLVVIAIIAVLAGLLFPLVGIAMDKARQARAKNDAAQIAQALNGYLSEYGKFPVQSAGNVNSADLMNTIAAAMRPDPNNPREITFVSIPKARAQKNGAEADASSIYSSGYKDSWANDYEIRIDNEGGESSYDGRVEGPNGVVLASVIVWSKGDPNNMIAFQDPARWIKSWE